MKFSWLTYELWRHSVDQPCKFDHKPDLPVMDSWKIKKSHTYNFKNEEMHLSTCVSMNLLSNLQRPIKKQTCKQFNEKKASQEFG